VPVNLAYVKFMGFSNENNDSAWNSL